MKVFGIRELDHVAGLIFGARERAVQTERHRLVGQQLQIAGIELDGRAFFGAARRQAERAQLVLSPPPSSMK